MYFIWFGLYVLRSAMYNIIVITISWGQIS